MQQAICHKLRGFSQYTVAFVPARRLTLRLHFLKRSKNSTMQWARCKTLRPLNHQAADQFCSDRSLLRSRVLIVSEETLKWLAASWQRSSERSFPRKSQTAS